MNEVKRFNPFVYGDAECEDGKYVLLSDYNALLDELRTQWSEHYAVEEYTKIIDDLKKEVGGYEQANSELLLAIPSLREEIQSLKAENEKLKSGKIKFVQDLAEFLAEYDYNAIESPDEWTIFCDDIACFIKNYKEETK